MPQNANASPGFFFSGQAAHFLLLIALVTSACLLTEFEHLANRYLFGLNGVFWFLIALSVPILHQVFVWLVWRSELCFGAVSKWLGARAFLIYRIAFFALFGSRPISLGLLAIVDHDSLVIPVYVRVMLCVILAIPTIYTFYSIVRFFGFTRATGADHFVESYRHMPMVKAGNFRFSSNAMYMYAFLGFWIIGIACASWAALVIVAFSHAYIWAHYYCTERPDMKLIYGG